MLARVIDYTIDDGRGNTTEYRLLTTLLDPVDAPAAELAVAYAQRWEIESTFDELNALEPLLHTQAMVRWSPTASMNRNVSLSRSGFCAVGQEEN